MKLLFHRWNIANTDSWSMNDYHLYLHNGIFHIEALSFRALISDVKWIDVSNTLFWNWQKDVSFIKQDDVRNRWLNKRNQKF